MLNYASAQSPHGDRFKVDCAECHSSESWKELKKDITFDHSKTGFELTGQHQTISCMECHQSLQFSKEKKECKDCHIDVHNNTVGLECDRCHNPESWIVQNITRIHQLSRFPLLGSHTTADCFDCHKSNNNLQFEPLDIECSGCHMNDYLATTNPNHQRSGYPTICTECHSARSVTWSATGIDHSFFPLQGGHSISCNDCHQNGTYSKIPSECISCHQDDYNTTSNPNHNQLEFSTNCSDCHDLSPGWNPARYLEHDAQSFPIYSGSHNNAWSSCIECHSTEGNYADFTCISCHEHNKTETDEEHGEVNGYAYQSLLCFECHPRGDVTGAFNHNSTGFPLTGAHLNTVCSDCHQSGYAGTSTECSDCHQPDYNQSSNPNHTTLGIPVSCADCHSTDPGWEPATFQIHNNYYELTGAHSTIANDCATCHKGNYNATPNTCYACHTNDYTSTTSPNHVTENFSTDCQTCHTTNAWQPATFDHNNTGFPLTGAHATISNNCNTCHNGNYTNTPNTCYECHSTDYNNTSDPNHQAAGFPVDCESCHSTTAWEPSTFDHDNQFFPIYSGTHREAWNSCSDCHTVSTNFSSFSCVTCHEHNQTEMNDKHSEVNGYSYNSISCFDCHPTGRN